MPRITLIQNFPRKELKREGFGKSLTSKNIDPGEWVSPAVGPLPVSELKWQDGALPEGMWKEPHKGILMLKPTFLKSELDSSEDVDFFDFGDESQVKVTGGPGFRMLAVRPSTLGFTLIELLVDIAIQAIISAMNLTAVARSKEPLLPNESFSVVLQPGGRAVERIRTILSVVFGGRYLIEVRTNGEFAFAIKQDGEYKIVLRETFKGGGVDHKLPIQISVIPWGPSYISILFSNFTGFAAKKTPSVGANHTEAFFIDLSVYGVECPWDDPIAQHIKVAPGHVVLSVPKPRPFGGVTSLPFVAFAFYRGRYGQEEVELGPFEIRDKRAETPESFVYGFFDYDSSRVMAPKMGWSFTDSTSGGDWDPFTDRYAKFALQMIPSPNAVYTPEFWQVDWYIKEEVWTPPWVPIDRSEDWSMLRFQRSSKPESSRLEAKLQRGDYSRVLHRGGPVRVEVDGIAVWDGYVVDREPTPEGASGADGVKGRIREEWNAHDMWHRLNTKYVSIDLSLDGQSVGTILKRLILQAGFEDGDVYVQPDVETVRFGDIPDAGDLKIFTNDSSIGDAVRDIQKVVNIQFSEGLRVRWDGSRWVIKFATAWDESEGWPNNIILLDSSLLAVWDGTPLPDRTDAERWNADQSPERERFLLAANDSGIEISVTKPEFNSLKVVTQVGGALSASGVACYITPSPDVLENPSHPDFEGCERIKIVGPPEVANVKDANESAIVARVIYDSAQRRGMTAQVGAEWQPWMDADNFVMVLGRNEDGDPCSYGCWRVERIDVQIDSDADIEGNSTSWKWEANYELVYQAPTNHPLFPMITSIGGPA